MPVRDDHQELLIVKGVAAAKGDTTSSEVGLTSISLLSEQGMAGWSLESEGGWSPNIPAFKSGGLFADSAVGPGRTLVAGEDLNPIETLQVTVTGDNILDLSARMVALGRMRQAILDFWTNPREIDPVYLRWWAKGAPGPQFALIYTLDYAVREPDVWQEPVRDVTITIEREPYWRGLPPGMNPKVWTHEQIRHVINWTSDDLNLQSTGAASDVNHALSGTVTNNDLSPANNYLEIAAANVPGDAPALLQLTCELENVAEVDYYIAVRSEPFDYANIASSFISTLDASTAGLGTDAATAADATVATGNRVNITPGTAADSLRLSTSVQVPAYQGRFALFMRAYQSGGAAGDWRAHIEVIAATTFVVSFTTLILPEQQFEVGATQWPPVYMGEMQLPMGIEAGITIQGQGIEETTYGILVYARRTTGTSTLRIADLVLMPIDEDFVHVITQQDTSKISNLVIDNTGYLSHGKPGEYAAPLVSGSTGVQFGLSEIRGQGLHLTPGKINRVYFMDTAASVCTPVQTFQVRGNIVPRWRNIRDV